VNCVLFVHQSLNVM